MHDRGMRPEASTFGEQLDRAQAMLGHALLDLPRLLVGVDVQRQSLRGRVAAELDEPLARAGADGVGSDADAGAVRSQLLEIAEVVRDRLLPEALDAAARVGDVEDDELDSDRGRGLGRRARLVEAEVVELPDGGVPRRAHLREDGAVVRADAGGELQHRLAPSPEVTALHQAPERPLERVAVRIHEARDLEIVRHAGENTGSASPPRGGARNRISCRSRSRPGRNGGDLLLPVVRDAAA